MLTLRNEKKTAIILGGTHDHITLISWLKAIGYFTILIDYYEEPPAKSVADLHLRESTLDKELVLQIAIENKAQLVISACIDQALLTMCYVAEKLNLPAPFSYEVALNVTNKVRMKEIITQNGLPTANYFDVKSLSDISDRKISYPQVVKPADSNGSFGVKKVFDFNELINATSKALEISRSRSAIIEEFIDGDEISVDTFIKKGKAIIIMMSELQKINSAENGFPIYQSKFPVNINERAKKTIEEIANKIAQAFSLDNTPLLIQVLVKQDEVNLIEFGARIGGGSKIHFIKLVTGFDIMDAFLASLFSKKVDVQIRKKIKHGAINYVYCYPGIIDKIEGLDELIEGGTIAYSYQYKPNNSIIDGYYASRDRFMSFVCISSDQIGLNEKLKRVNNKLKLLDKNGMDKMIHEIF